MSLYHDYNTIGHIIGGSLRDGLIVELYAESIPSSGIGSFIVVKTATSKILCVIVDCVIEVPSSILQEYDPELSYLLEKIHKQACRYRATTQPLWEIREKNVQRVSFMPACFSFVYHAHRDDITHVWNSLHPHDTHFSIGTLCGGGGEVTVPLKALVRRSNAIFGKTGTGKTFIARYIFGGIIAHKIAALLIFDMHNEYAYYARQEHTQGRAEGLKILFPQHVMVATLDQKKGSDKCDILFKIPLSMIHIDDVLALQRELVLHPTACEAAYLLYARFTHRWLSILMERESDLANLAHEVGAHVESITALHRKLKRVVLLSFIAKENEDIASNGLNSILSALTKGISVIVEFGSCNHTLSYLLVSNVLTRMLHNAHIKKTEQFIEQKGTIEPVHVVIVIEEAHKFLHPSLAHQTSFGIIAREMRKYYLSLFIIDQRPSHIDDEILSQLGTKFLLGLSDGRDCDAVLHGVEKAYYVKSLLETLAVKQQVIVIGHIAPLVAKVHIHDYRTLAAFVAHKNQSIKSLDAVIESLF